MFRFTYQTRPEDRRYSEGLDEVTVVLSSESTIDQVVEGFALYLQAVSFTPGQIRAAFAAASTQGDTE